MSILCDQQLLRSQVHSRKAQARQADTLPQRQTYAHSRDGHAWSTGVHLKVDVENYTCLLRGKVFWFDTRAYPYHRRITSRAPETVETGRLIQETGVVWCFSC